MLNITSKQATRFIRTEKNKFKEIKEGSALDKIFFSGDVITLASKHRLVQLNVESELEEIELNEIVDEKIKIYNPSVFRNKVELSTETILEEIKEFSKNYQNVLLRTDNTGLIISGVSLRSGKNKLADYHIEGNFREWETLMDAQYLEDALMLAKKCKLNEVILRHTLAINNPTLLHADGFYYLIAPKMIRDKE